MTNPVVHRRTFLDVCNLGDAHAETNRHLLDGCAKVLAAALQVHDSSADWHHRVVAL